MVDEAPLPIPCRETDPKPRGREIADVERQEGRRIQRTDQRTPPASRAEYDAARITEAHGPDPLPRADSLREGTGDVVKPHDKEIQELDDHLG